MTKVLCVATCYMPVKKGKDHPMERYEDEYDDERDIFDIPANRVKEFLDTGNFRLIDPPEGQ